MKKKKKIFGGLALMLAIAVSLCLSGCVKSSSSVPETVRETENYIDKAPTFDLSDLESTISFDGLDLSGADRILVQLAYCDPEKYSYWIKDADTISKVSDIVKEIEGDELFHPLGLFALELCVTFYSGDSELFYIGLGYDHFESGTKIIDNIEGARYHDAYRYCDGSENKARELIRMLRKSEWSSAQ